MSADLVNLARAGWSSNAVSAILVDHEIRWSTLTEDSSDALRGWAGVLRSVFTAADLEELCAVTNGLLERGTSRAYLTIHDRLRRTYISFPMRKTSLPESAPSRVAASPCSSLNPEETDSAPADATAAASSSSTPAATVAERTARHAAATMSPSPGTGRSFNGKSEGLSTLVLNAPVAAHALRGRVQERQCD